MVEEGVRTIAGLVLECLDDVVERLGERYREVPEYDALSDEVMRAEVLPMSRQVVATFLQALVEDREPELADGADIGQIGRRRLGMGVPLEPMLHVYRLCGRTVWETAAEVAPSGDGRALARLGTLWMDWIDRAASAAAAAYLDASHERLRRLDARRGALLEAILAARDDAEVAAVGTEFATPIAMAYTPMIVMGEAVAGRIDLVLSALPPGTLAGVRAGAVAALVPAGEVDAARVLELLPGSVIAVGPSVAPGHLLTRALLGAEGVARAATARNRSGVFGPDDLLVDQLLAADPRVAATLGAIVARLDPGDRAGTVLETLAVYLRSGSVPDTAAMVSAHPNTVVYRLRKVAQLTGFDPRIPEQAAHLVLGLAVVESTTRTRPDLGFGDRSRASA